MMKREQYLVDNLNWDHLRRNQPFKHGLVHLSPEYNENAKNLARVKQGKAKKQDFAQFQNLPCILPVKIRDQNNDTDIPLELDSREEEILESKVAPLSRKSQENAKHQDENDINTGPQETFKNQRTMGRNQDQMNNMDFNLPENRDEFTKNVDVIEPGKVIYDKPIAIIYNPNAGKKRNIRAIISQRLDAAGIKHEYLESKRVFDTWIIPQEMDLDRVSALVAVGGDGTFHEVVNGMLHRADKRKVPIAFIGNGSGNDTLIQFNANDIQRALDFIVKGDLLKYDVGKVLLDYENEEDVPPEQINSNLRYSLINSVFGVSAKINHSAIGYKRCCCNPYQLAALKEFCRLSPVYVTIEADGEVVYENIPLILIGVFNTKYGGGGFNLSPYSTVNDGMLEVILYKDKIGFGGMVGIMDDSMKYQGIHGYSKSMEFYRAKNIKVINMMPLEKPKNKNDNRPPMKQLQLYAIDGEVFHFRDFVKYETLHNEIEVIVDFDYLMNDKKQFVKNSKA
ncbi:transcriptional regulator [Stylonychia lemnae]|uniref:Transcriptional regulator n=1 Tax=Stylonychia lemnae TaxID=5949 RepID=A0A077ZZV7_STYLE|nr:transcriptional regulator [Stylonychia lemnae]|eukprot:CDW74738.1 transcriptional regulator [Stylonychia lemnae]